MSKGVMIVQVINNFMNLLYLFAAIWIKKLDNVYCMKQLYNLRGSIIDILGDPKEKNTQEKFDRLLAFRLNLDKES